MAKASLVGAKTVKGPAPARVSTRPAAVTAATNVLNLSSPTAISTMFLEALGAAGLNKRKLSYKIFLY